MKEERVHLTLTLQIWLVLIHIIGLKKKFNQYFVNYRKFKFFFFWFARSVQGEIEGSRVFTVFSKQDRLRKETCARSDCHLHFLEQTFVYVCVSEVKVVSDVESGAGSLVTPFKNEEINIRSFFSIFFLKEVRPLPTEKTIKMPL